MGKKSIVFVTSLLAVVLLSSCASLMLSISDPDWHKVQGSMYAKTDSLNGGEEIRDYMTLGHGMELVLYIRRQAGETPVLLADTYYQTTSPNELGLIESALVYDADNPSKQVIISFNTHLTDYEVGNGWWSASTTAGHIEDTDIDQLHQILEAPNPAVRIVSTDGSTRHVFDRNISRNANYRALKVLEYYNAIVQ